jgi:hypothetical protein
MPIFNNIALVGSSTGMANLLNTVCPKLPYIYIYRACHEKNIKNIIFYYIII